MYTLIDVLAHTHTLNEKQLHSLIQQLLKDEQLSQYLYQKARDVATQIFGKQIYIRGLIEISNYCKNDCYYCGIRRSNHKIHRYRLTLKDIMACCEEGYELGFRTFVLQSGEDLYYQDEIMCEIISSIKTRFPDCAITLSLGEKSLHTYERYKEAGADRYLLRHETIDEVHYGKLHPKELQLKKRIECLDDLKKIGFQVGSGVMVGSPYQSIHMLVQDLIFLKQLQPAMIGIGPYLPHKDTPFHDQQKGSMDLTLILISILRLMHPYALIPATTALSTIHPQGREKGILAGANVVMPNLSPSINRKDYALYDNKACTNEEAKEGLEQLKERMRQIGYELVCARGDFEGETNV